MFITFLTLFIATYFYADVKIAYSPLTTYFRPKASHIFSRYVPILVPETTFITELNGKFEFHITTHCVAHKA